MQKSTRLLNQTILHLVSHSFSRSICQSLTQSVAQAVHSFSEGGEVGAVSWDKAPRCFDEVILNLGIFSHSVPVL